jgi:hypothetical protein
MECFSPVISFHVFFFTATKGRIAEFSVGKHVLGFGASGSLGEKVQTQSRDKQKASRISVEVLW